MTEGERLADLERRVAVFEAFFSFGLSDDGRIPYVMTRGRFGVMTDYWSRKPWGQGAALSVGTVSDRFGIYAEVEAATCPDHPTTAIYASVPIANGQRNIAVEAHAAHSSEANVVLYADGDGIELAPSVGNFYLGKLGGLIRRLWPT